MMWRVRDWDKVYENNRSRVIENTTWVPMPNKHDSDGYLQLMDNEHGALHYGAWCALVQVASKCKPRGTLVRDGKPHTCESLARQTRIGTHVFLEAIPRFLSEEIGWLEEVDESQLTPDCRSPDARVFSTMSTKERKERKEQKERNSGRPVGSVGFLEEDFDSENWKTASRLHVDAANKLWPKRNWDRAPMKPEDRCLLLKAAYLAVTRLSQDWWHTALEETIRSNPQKPLGLFKTCLWKWPRSEGLDFNALLDAVRVPVKPASKKKPTTQEARAEA